jgi:NAD(P)H-hydrate repair Nnr-like enzyme with NAD(P)H-hydrate epimerase domain
LRQSTFRLQVLIHVASVYKVHPPSRGRRILVACGPGNNGEFA